ncbi:hypothetical protein KKF25_02950 [Patescibacteria group bacterium]|nr:hypothetical protein [Patescibacteria group bacterium]
MRTMEFGNLAGRLADIRKMFTATIEQINAAAGGEAFYARIFFAKDKEDKRVIGLISDLRVNEYKILFNLTGDKKVSKKEIEFEKIKRIEVFKTASGKPMFIE